MNNVWVPINILISVAMAMIGFQRIQHKDSSGFLFFAFIVIHWVLFLGRKRNSKP